MGKYVSGSFYSLTDKGMVREANEDSAITKINAYGDVVLAVADGMGGRNKGDYASNYLCSLIGKEFSKLDKKFKNSKAASKWLYKVINKANRDIYSKANKDPLFAKMGTTLSLIFISNNFLILAQVGDSRVYSIKDNKLVQLSIDQSYVQYLEHSKIINKEQAKSHPERHKITNAIGIRYNCNVDFLSFEYEGQKLMLCSDGVYNNVSETDILSILKSSDTPERKCRQIINFGNANGGSDNMACIIWEANN